MYIVKPFKFPAKRRSESWSAFRRIFLVAQCGTDYGGYRREATKAGRLLKRHISE